MNHDLKFARGVSGLPEGRRPPLGGLEKITLFHVATLVIAGSWYFGGNSAGAQLFLSCWGSLGVFITAAAIREQANREPARLRPLLWLLPLVAFNGIVLLSLINPSFRQVVDGSRHLYLEDHARLALPSSARPDLSAYALWFFDAVYLSCFNLVLAVHHRRALRTLLLVLLGNAVVLAVFGTAQKLLGAKGLFFGLVKSPQVFFFASFVYHNHWGAFTVLMVATGLALVFHFLRRNESRDFWHSPAFAGLVAIGLLAATVPLSGSRSCTIIVALLLLGAFGYWLVQLTRRNRDRPHGVFWPAVGAILVVGSIASFGYDLAQPMIKLRIEATRDQVSQLQTRGDFGSRAVLYRDTWNMAREKPWFGWGMGSYPTVFFLRNSQRERASDGLPLHFHDAHSDWLQSLAEVGFVGTTLLGLTGAIPLFARRRSILASPISSYLVVGCGLLLLYAWLEFPFGNRAVIAAFWTCLFTAVHYGRADGTNR